MLGAQRRTRRHGCHLLTTRHYTGRLAGGGRQREAAARLAVDEINRAGSNHLPVNYTVSLFSYDTETEEKATARAALALLDTAGVAGLIGAASSTNSQAAALLAGLFKKPQISYSSTSSYLSDKARYPFFARMLPSDSIQALGLVQLVKRLGWSRVTVIYTQDSYGEALAESFVQHASREQVALVARIPFAASDSMTDIQAKLQVANPRFARVILLFCLAADAKLVLRAANPLGLVTKDHAWLSVDGVMQNSLFTTDAGDGRGEQRDEELVALTDGLLGTVPGQAASPRLEAFLDTWEKLSPDEYAGAGSREINTYAPYAYDCVLAFAAAIKSLVAQGGDYNDGTALLQELVGLRGLSGLTGEITFDESTYDRQQALYTLKNVRNGTLVDVGLWTVDSGVELSEPVQWHGGAEQPADSGSCEAPLVDVANEDERTGLITLACVPCEANQRYVASGSPDAAGVVADEARCEACGGEEVVTQNGTQCRVCATLETLEVDEESGERRCQPVGAIVILLSVLATLFFLLLVCLSLWYVRRRTKLSQKLRDEERRRQILLQEKANELSRSNDLLSERNAQLATEIAKRRKTMREVKRARAHAVAANSAKTVLLSNMSHELRTPLTTILLVHSLLRDSGLTRLQEELSAQAATSTRLMLGMINDLLDFGKMEEKKMVLFPRVTNLFELVEDPVRLVSATRDSTAVDIVCEVMPGCAEYLVMCDDIRVKQIVLNLVSNAKKFTAHGYVHAQVSVASGDGATERRLRKKLGGVPGIVVQIVVSDSGSGIAQELVAAMFERFRQASESTAKAHGGFGLGLNIVQQLVGLMGGEIYVQSTVGVGSRFRVLLPLRLCPPDDRALQATNAAAFENFRALQRMLKVREMGALGTGDVDVFVASRSELLTRIVANYTQQTSAACRVRTLVSAVFDDVHEWLLANVDAKRTTVIVLDEELACHEPAYEDESAAAGAAAVETTAADDSDSEACPTESDSLRLRDAFVEEPLCLARLMVVSDRFDAPLRHEEQQRAVVVVSTPMQFLKFSQGLEELLVLPSGELVAARSASSMSSSPERRVSVVSLSSNAWGDPAAFVSPLTGNHLSLHVLLAEDHTINRRLIERLLTSSGHTVTSCVNGRELVDAYTAEPDQFDVILCDVQMPVLGGLEATREIRRWETTRGRHVAIISLTANAMKSDEDACLVAGMDAFLAKPVQKAALLMTIQRTVLSVADRKFATQQALSRSELRTVSAAEPERSVSEDGAAMAQSASRVSVLLAEDDALAGVRSAQQTTDRKAGAVVLHEPPPSSSDGDDKTKKKKKKARASCTIQFIKWNDKDDEGMSLQPMTMPSPHKTGTTKRANSGGKQRKAVVHVHEETDETEPVGHGGGHDGRRRASEPNRSGARKARRKKQSAHI